jgi:hypothetical protein
VTQQLAGTRSIETAVLLGALEHPPPKKKKKIKAN